MYFLSLEKHTVQPDLSSSDDAFSTDGLVRWIIGLHQSLRELFKLGQYLHSTKNRPKPEPFVLNASSVQDESG